MFLTSWKHIVISVLISCIHWRCLVITRIFMLKIRKTFNWKHKIKLIKISTTNLFKRLINKLLIKFFLLYNNTVMFLIMNLVIKSKCRMNFVVKFNLELTCLQTNNCSTVSSFFFTINYSFFIYLFICSTFTISVQFFCILFSTTVGFLVSLVYSKNFSLCSSFSLVCCAFHCLESILKPISIFSFILWFSRSSFIYPHVTFFKFALFLPHHKQFYSFSSLPFISFQFISHGSFLSIRFLS